MNVGDKIKALRANLNISQTELASRIGIAKQTLYKYENGIVTNIPSDKIELIADALETTPVFLMGWDEPNASILNQTKIRSIPVYESVSAGFGAVAQEQVMEYVPLYIESDFEASETLCAVVSGDSMFPKIEHGDVVQIQKTDTCDSGDIAVVMRDDSDMLVKKVIFNGKSVELHSINPMYPPQIFEGRDMKKIKILGKVKKIIKSL